jgi:hypothetical protein
VNHELIATVLIGLATLGLMWQQNRILQRQNEIFAQQEKAITTKTRWKYWPIFAMAMLMLFTWAAVAVDYFYVRPAPGSNATQQDIPEFDAKTTAIVEGYGLDSPESCYAVVNGNALLTRQKDYKLAAACFIYDGREDLLDAPYVQFSNLYDIKDGQIRMRLQFPQYFVDYRNRMNAIGIDVSVLNVPNGVELTSFRTLRQARTAGVKILSHTQAIGGIVQQSKPSP